MKVVAPVWADGVKNTREGEGQAPVQTTLTLYVLIFGTGKALSKPLEGKKAYVHVIQVSSYNEWQATEASIKFSTKGRDEVELREGGRPHVDVKKKGAILEVENVGNQAAELLVFDLRVRLYPRFCICCALHHSGLQPIEFERHKTRYSTVKRFLYRNFIHSMSAFSKTKKRQN